MSLPVNIHEVIQGRPVEWEPRKSSEIMELNGKTAILQKVPHYSQNFREVTFVTGNSWCIHFVITDILLIAFSLIP